MSKDETIITEVIEPEVVEAVMEDDAPEVKPLTLDDLEEVKARYNAIQEANVAAAKEVAKNVKLSNQEETKALIEKALSDVHQVSHNEHVEIGFGANIVKNGLSLIPFKGKDLAEKFVDSRVEKDIAETLDGTADQAVTALVDTLVSQQEILEKGLFNLIDIKDRRIADYGELVQMQEMLLDLKAQTTDSKELYKVNKILMQVQKTVISSDEKIDQIANVIVAAEVNCSNITEQIPDIQNNLLDGVSIADTLNTLLQQKSMYESVQTVAQDVSEENFKKTSVAMLNAVDLDTQHEQTSRMLQLSDKKIELDAKLKKRIAQNLTNQDNIINGLSKVQAKLGQIGARATDHMQIASPVKADDE